MSYIKSQRAWHHVYKLITPFKLYNNNVGTQVRG